MRQLKITKNITTRDTASINLYLLEISRYKLLTVEEEIELTQQIKEGNKSALNKLINANLRFVVSVAKQHQNQGLSLPDLINEGNLGLIKSAQKFDPSRGFKFISYAVWWIRQSITASISENSRTVRLPLNKIGFLNKINKFKENFLQKNNYSPSIAQIAEGTGFDPEFISKLNPIKGISLNTPCSSDNEDNTLENLMEQDMFQATDQILLQESTLKILNNALKKIDTREAFIIKNLFGIECQPKTLDEIAFSLSLTKERARQLKNKGIRKMKELHSFKNLFND